MAMQKQVRTCVSCYENLLVGVSDPDSHPVFEIRSDPVFKISTDPVRTSKYSIKICRENIYMISLLLYRKKKVKGRIRIRLKPT